MTNELQQGFSQVTHELQQGFSQVTHELQQGFTRIDQTLQTGFARVIEELAVVRTTAEELVAVARSPNHTAALEHFRVARDAYLRGLLPEALEGLTHAIDGVAGVSTGYKLDWRFHSLRGLIYLGGGGGRDPSTVDPIRAYASFELAIRYLDPQELARKSAFLTFCGKARVLLRTESGDAHALSLFLESIQLDGNNLEARIDFARVAVRRRRLDEGLQHLFAACKSDLRTYAWAERDPELTPYLEDVRRHKAAAIVELKRSLPGLQAQFLESTEVADRHMKTVWLVRSRRVDDDPVVKRWLRAHFWQFIVALLLLVVPIACLLMLGPLKGVLDFFVYQRVKELILYALLMIPLGLVLLAVHGGKTQSNSLARLRQRAAERLQHDLRAALSATSASLARAVATADEWLACVSSLAILGVKGSLVEPGRAACQRLHELAEGLQRQG